MSLKYVFNKEDLPKNSEFECPICFENIDIDELVKTNEDYKSQLQIFCQKNKLSLEYRLMSEEQLGIGKHFVIQVFVNDKPYTRFENYSKRLAEQKAAQLTLEELKKEIG